MLPAADIMVYKHASCCRHYGINMLPAADKMIFLDIIIDDDAGEKEEGRDIVPYQLSKEAVVMDMKVQDITVRSNANKSISGSPG